MESGNNVSCLAALCHDSILSQGNRFDSLIANISQKYALNTQQSAELWLDKFLSICIEPLLWILSYYGIALEAHQQNLLVKLDTDGLPIYCYYRDSQGYYILVKMRCAVIGTCRDFWYVCQWNYRICQSPF